MKCRGNILLPTEWSLGVYAAKVPTVPAPAPEGGTRGLAPE